MLIESAGGSAEKPKVRSVKVINGAAVSRVASPVIIGFGDTFQITAASQLGHKPRMVSMTAQIEGTCSGAKHPALRWQDSDGQHTSVGTTASLKFYRQPLPSDSFGPAFFAMLRSAFDQASQTYSVFADTCGISKTNPPVPVGTLGARIEVFPADRFKVELTFPAVKSVDLASGKTEGWKTQQDLDDEQVEDAGKQAKDIYKSTPGDDDILSQSDFVDIAKDVKKNQINYIEPNKKGYGSVGQVLNGLGVSMTQTDGERVIKANLDEVIKLIRLKCDIVYRCKEIWTWIDQCPQPPGASFSLDADFLTGSLSAEWGYAEYIDDRVYMALTGKVSIKLVELSLTAKFGIQTGGLVNIIAFFTGSGSISITAQVQIENPDEMSPPEVNPSGEITFSGGVQGTLFWIAKAEGKVEITFTAETEKLIVLQKGGIFQGEAVVKRSDLQAVVTTSFSLWGSRATTHRLIKGDSWTFPIGEGE
jgi:hypothetical protein